MASLLTIPVWERFPWLRAAFTTRVGGVSTAYAPGDLNLGWTPEDTAEAVIENRRRATAAISRSAAMLLITMRQVHGDTIRPVSFDDNPLATPAGKATLECDGLMTGAPGLLLGTQAADCIPILLADARLRIVAAVHAGWRGTRAGIAAKAVRAMQQEFGTRPQDVLAAIGPGIGPCCYTVGPEVHTAFRAAFADANQLFTSRADDLFLDLWEANRRQLVEAGVPAPAVTVLRECTACTRTNGTRKYFSYRAEQGKTGRAMGLIGIII